MYQYDPGLCCPFLLPERYEGDLLGLYGGGSTLSHLVDT